MSFVAIKLSFSTLDQVPHQFKRLWHSMECYKWWRLLCSFVTCCLFLVTRKKSSMRVCLLCPAAFSSSLSFLLFSRIWRNFSIRPRTLCSLKENAWINTDVPVVFEIDTPTKENSVFRPPAYTHTSSSTYLTCLSWQRNWTKASSSGSDQTRSGATVSGASRNNFLASWYCQKCGTGCVWRQG